MSNTQPVDDVRKWEAELHEAGWTRYHGMATVWQAPDGSLYRGPYGAWLVMRGESHG